MRFLLDEDLPPTVATIAVGQYLDVTSVQLLGRTGLSDTSRLQFAAADQRVLVTRNRDDFIRLTREYYATNQSHFGVLIVSRTHPNTGPAAIAEGLRRWSARYRGTEPGLGFLDFL